MNSKIALMIILIINISVTAALFAKLKIKKSKQIDCDSHFKDVIKIDNIWMLIMDESEETNNLKEMFTQRNSNLVSCIDFYMAFLGKLKKSFGLY